MGVGVAFSIMDLFGFRGSGRRRVYGACFYIPLATLEFLSFH